MHARLRFGFKAQLAGASRVALLVMCLGMFGATAAAAGQSFPGGPHAGQRVYYETNAILTPDEAAQVDAAAAAVERAGVPVVVYLRLKNADTSQTEQDAADLANAWNVQSADHAQDGLVILANLKPRDPKHGSMYLYAGKALVESGRLPVWESQRIFDTQMAPDLREGKLADGLQAGLTAVASDLVNGVPVRQPSAFERFASAASWPIDVAGLAFGGLVFWRRRARLRRPVAAPITVVPPSALAPALAGALAAGQTEVRQAQAAVFELCGRGAVRLESANAGKRKQVQLRLVRQDDPAAFTTWEATLWAGLQQLAGPDNVIASKALPKLRGVLAQTARALHQELEQLGLLVPAPEVRGWRRPWMVVGVLGLVLAILLFFVSLFGPAMWLGALGAFGGGFLALHTAGSIPATTPGGAVEAEQWRGFRRGLRELRKHKAGEPSDWTALVPYAVALLDASDARAVLARAEKAGYLPGVLELAAPEFYELWRYYDTYTSPSSSGSDGGAGDGGGGGGGSF